MATPSALATCRTVLLTAEPAPAFSRGTALMMAFVAGDIVSPMPRPIPTISSSMTHCGIDSVVNAYRQKVRPKIAGPLPLPTGGPYLVGSFDDSGAATTTAPATAISAVPAARAV